MPEHIIHTITNGSKDLTHGVENITEIELGEPTQKSVDKPTTFENAILATGYGKFNFLLVLLCIPAIFSSQFEVTMMSFVFPVAQCDLNLSLNDKGTLNAITYIGMISSGFAWGYLADTLGRKKVLAIGYLLDAFFVLLCAISQNFTMVLIAKFMGGCVVNGPLSALTSYISEFHCAKYRARQQMILGFILSLGNIVLPLLGMAIFPIQIDLYILNGLIELHSWNFYIFVCSIPSLISGTIFCFMPESPKFLMTVGKNQEALKVLKMVYSFNTGKSLDSYPVKHLINENKLKETEHVTAHITVNRTKSQALKEGWLQLKPLFFIPHLTNILMVCYLQLMMMMGMNTLRLWLPQIFQAINDYKHYNNGTTTDLCDMLDLLKPSINQTECVVITDNASVYTNVIIVAISCMIGYTAAGYLINKLGKTTLLCVLGLSSGICGCSMYFAKDSVTVVILSSMFIAIASICSKVLLAVIVDLFPTTLRTMSVSIAMTFGRLGAMSGNLLFPIFLSLGCALPFFTIGTALILSGFVSLKLPNTDMKALV